MPIRRSLLALLVLPLTLGAQSTLDRSERAMRAEIASRREEQIAYLERLVNIPSGTLNVAGVREVGRVIGATLDSMGFESRWVDLPASMKRAGHLVSTHTGKPGSPRVLLIGHLDTVFEGPNQNFVREDTIGRGAGSNDMKGGDVIILYALKAMQAAGALRNLNVTVILTGDEEYPGDPLGTARAALIDAAKACDIALAFEGGSRTQATIGRRSAGEWTLKVTGQQGHSSGVFRNGYGAIYEAARILDEFRRELASEENLTFNPGTITGGSTVAYDTLTQSGTAASKTNIIAPVTWVQGDLRAMNEAQIVRAQTKMREIVARNLRGTSAEITFGEGYPPMAVTPGGERLLSIYSGVSAALGYGALTASDPARRGAGDLSFVAPFIDGIEGLGALGSGSHSPNESVNLPALTMQTERAAIMLYRLSKQKAESVRRTPKLWHFARTMTGRTPRAHRAQGLSHSAAMIRATIVTCAALLATAAPLPAQRLTAGVLQAREVPRPDTVVTWRSGERDLLAELRVPSGRGPHPLAIVIHGGCWVTKFADARYMYPMAEALRANGIATWTISYRRADEPGGGWPGTFLDVAEEARLVQPLARRFDLDLTRVIATGHSAGAHLALWLAAQPKLPLESGVRAAANALPIAAVVAIDGPGDLVNADAGITRICGGNVLEQLLGGLPAAVPDRWRLASPSEWLPLGVPQAMVRGGLDARLPALGSEAGSMPVYAARARASGDSSWVVMTDSTNHFSMLDPQHGAFATYLQAMKDALAAITKGR